MTMVEVAQLRDHPPKHLGEALANRSSGRMAQKLDFLKLNVLQE